MQELQNVPKENRIQLKNDPKLNFEIKNNKTVESVGLEHLKDVKFKQMFSNKTFFAHVFGVCQK